MDSEVLTAQMDPVELRNVNIEPDDESISGECIQDNYTRLGNSEKAAMNRYEKKYQNPWGEMREVY